MSYRCLGCDAHTPWDGEGLFSYTCSCRATVFYDDETNSLALPASLMINLSMDRPVPHFSDLIGDSDHTSPLKEQFISDLKTRGFIWMGECEQCQKDGTLKREIERKQHWAEFNREHKSAETEAP